MLDSRFQTLEGRKASFMTLYNEQKYDIVETANKLGITVGTSQSMPDDILGFIRYRDNIFQVNLHGSVDPWYHTSTNCVCPESSSC